MTAVKLRPQFIPGWPPYGCRISAWTSKSISITSSHSASLRGRVDTSTLTGVGRQAGMGFRCSFGNKTGTQTQTQTGAASPQPRDITAHDSASQVVRAVPAGSSCGSATEYPHGILRRTSVRDHVGQLGMDAPCGAVRSVTKRTHWLPSTGAVQSRPTPPKGDGDVGSRPRPLSRSFPLRGWCVSQPASSFY